MSLDAGVLILVTVIGAATPLLLAALGELVVEKSGVLNLGIEGMMLAGAVTAFATAITTGSSGLGIRHGRARRRRARADLRRADHVAARQSGGDGSGAHHLRHRAQRARSARASSARPPSGCRGSPSRA